MKVPRNIGKPLAIQNSHPHTWPLLRVRFIAGAIMVSHYPCKHCNGTTFCSASRDGAGQLKTRPACVCCLVKAGLNPNAIYDKVICSVCGGTGLVEPARERPRPRPIVDRALLVVLPALLAAVVVLAAGGWSYYRQRLEYEAVVDQLLEERGGAAVTLSLSEARALVQGGMTGEAVRAALGEPYAVRQGEGEQEFWIYRCKDGKMIVTLINGAVYGRQ
jgi:hypothetical protein